MKSFIDQLKFDDRGLIPSIIQDSENGEVLMMAYMNRESLLKTLESGQTCFYSRSRQEIWFKGATSGHTQQVVSMQIDCDEDTILVKVRQKGAACHTGKRSCFYRSVKSDGEIVEM